MTSEQRFIAARADIPFLAYGIYVDTAAVSPMPISIQKSSDDYNTLAMHRLRDASAIAKDRFDLGRRLAAKLINAKPQSIAYVQNTSHGLSLVSMGLDWRAGDNLVISAQEFPSNYLCWAQLAACGVEIRTFSSSNGRVDPDHLRGLIDARTRIVAVSQVQFYSGFRVDLAAMGALCTEHGALLVVDGTQSVGAVGIDVTAAGVDVLIVSAHKWLMGPRGVGFASFSERAMAQIVPRVVGWLSVNEPFAFNRTLDYLPDARRFEPGTPNGTGIFGLVERLRQIDELGIEAIEARVLDLNERICEAADRRGIRRAYDFERASRSGIVMLIKDGVSPADLNQRLTANRIYASVRNGNVRVSPHYFNTSDEIDQVISAFDD